MPDVCLKEFLRKKVTNRKGIRQEVPVGTLWACCEDGQILVGYAQLHTGLDVQDKQHGLDVAMNRAYTLDERLKDLEVVVTGPVWFLKEPVHPFKERRFPFVVQKALPGFLVRCEKYFKQGKLTPWAAKVRAAMAA